MISANNHLVDTLLYFVPISAYYEISASMNVHTANYKNSKKMSFIM
jgi:hypothetical protein